MEGILPVALLQSWTTVDDADSEDVALHCVEWLFAETNAFHREHRRAAAAVHAVAATVRTHVIDAVVASTLCMDVAVDDARFAAEPPPVPSDRDRHSTRSVPLKAPPIERSTILPLSPSASGPPSTATARVAAPSVRPRRRKRPDNAPAKATAAPTPIVRVNTEPHDAEDPPELATWRASCLKDFELARRKPGFTKWATVARAFAHADPGLGGEPEVTFAPTTFPSSTLAKLQLKSGLDTFSTIEDLSRRPSQASVGEFDMFDTSPRSKVIRGRTGSVIGQRGNLVLNDKLAVRHRSASVWRNEGAAAVGGFEPPTDEMSLDLSTLTASNSVAAGVTVSHGEAVVEGPERISSPSTMSRKRFDLHQQVTMDLLLNGSEFVPLSPPLSSVGSSSGSPLPHSYVEVPPEAVAAHNLDPMLSDALAIPRTHLATSRSVPSLRVRTSSAGPSLSPMRHAQSTLSLAKPRPTTALRAPAKTPKYVREFPRPPKGVIRAAKPSNDAQRLAWTT